MKSKYDLSDTYIEMFYTDDSRFDTIRTLCLEEDNWLRNNYTKENLIIEDHSAYGVVFQKSTDKPMLMAGVFSDNRFPHNVARVANRLYTFPEFRHDGVNRQDIIDGCRVIMHLVDELISETYYDVYLITMQNRNKASKRWWQVASNTIKHISNDWVIGDGYISTCKANVQKCWHNYMYLESVPGKFQEWSPKIIDHEEWSLLIEGS